MTNISVLYIEDDDGQRESLAAALRGRGFAVRTAGSGSDGLDLLSRDGADAVLCDLNMPAMSGIDVLVRVKETHPDTPVLILTAHGTMAEAVEAIRRGAVDFIRKPPQIDEIEVSLRNAVERTSLAAEVSRLEESMETAVKQRTERLETAYQQMEQMVRKRTQELEDNAIALAQANVDLLGVQEELEQKNRELQQAEQRMMSIVQAAPLPLIVTRYSDGTIIYANQHIADIVGMRADDLIGRVSPDFYNDPADREEILRLLARDGRVVDREVRMKRGDGTLAWMLFSIVVTELGGERVIIGGLYDIDERKKAEAALQESEELFRGIVESANDIIFTLTPDLTISYVSPNVKKLLGYTPSGMMGTSTVEFLDARDAERTAAAFRRVLETGEPLNNYEHRVLHRDGSVRWYSLNATLVRASDGEAQFLVGIAHDFTERKLSLEALERAHAELRDAQSQLVQSEKMASLGMLVAGIAHEINTPVGAVASMHDTLRRSVDKLRAGVSELCAGEPDKMRRFETLFRVVEDANNVIKSGVERVTTIVRRLRSFARLDEAELKEADINEGIEDTLTLIHHEIKHNITVVKEFGKLPLVPCFPGRLNQVFLNLLVNARQAIQGKGTITVHTALEGHNVVIRISDTGVGIPESQIKRIFDPGFTTKGVGVGTGLGLSICYQIIEDHQGEISVESKQGEGTTFTIVIPDDLDERLEKRAEPEE